MDRIAITPETPPAEAAAVTDRWVTEHVPEVWRLAAAEGGADAIRAMLPDEAARALGMSTVASAFGGIFSIIVMIVAAPMLARAAYNFGPPEYFALAVFGLSMLGAVGGESGNARPAPSG